MEKEKEDNKAKGIFMNFGFATSLWTVEDRNALLISIGQRVPNLMS